MKKLKPKFRIWFEFKGKSILGKGGAEILQAIETYQSIKKVANELGLSYRFVWNYLRKIERRLGELVIKTSKGGYKGGGKTILTKTGKKLLNLYLQYKERIEKSLKL